LTLVDLKIFTNSLFSMDTRTFNRKYLKLVTGMDRRAKELWGSDADFIDGPDSMKEKAAALKRVPEASELQELALELLEVTGNPFTIHDYRRRYYLTEILTGLETTTRVLKGEDVPYREKLRAYFGINPRRATESVFERAMQRLDESLPGRGDIEARYSEWEKGQTLKPEEVEPLLRMLMEETRTRTAQYLDLPEDDRVDLEFVRDKPWSGYNTYRGDGVSVVAINLDAPMKISRLLEVGSHETYPGHHAEHMMKELMLGLKRGYVEENALTYNVPRNIVSEGIGELSMEIAFGNLRNGMEWYNAHTRGKKIDIDQDLAIRKAARNLDGARTNLCFMIHEDYVGEGEAMEYMQTWWKHKPRLIKPVTAFVKHPIFDTYSFNYTHGHRLVSQAYRDALRNGVPKDVVVERLFTTQLTPKTLHYLSEAA